MDYESNEARIPHTVEGRTATFCQEYLAHKGTIVKPYYWLTMNQGCTKCPYHIRTGEEARVPYIEFHQAFGFPYGPTSPQNKHLLFYELRNFLGKLMQKGCATNCTEYNIHPESMLFEMGCYLDSMLCNWENAAHIVLYSNYSPCNEAEHGCISKMYSFLMKYLDITICIYFSQLYHTEEDFPGSTWNCEALRSLASLWPRVTLSPLCGNLWHSLLQNFVRPPASLYDPVLPVRALADRQNAQQFNSITGITFPSMKILPEPAYGNLQKYYLSPSYFNHPAYMINRFPPLQRPSFHLSPLINVFPPLGKQPVHLKPRNIVRHLKLPNESLSKGNTYK
nr:putative C->U-editing enzyme APOBEC-4 [Pogona vitticeps]